MTDEFKTAVDASGSLLVAKKPFWRCPVCGYETERHDGLIVSINRHSGNYCLRCYARWIADNIPKMQPISGA